MTDHLPATEIQITAFRQILIWPLLIHDGRGNGAINANAVVSKLVDSGWQAGDSASAYQAVRLRDLPWYGTNGDFDYSEITYFHSFVRDVLYGGDRTDADDQPMRVLRRSDVHGLKLSLIDGRTFELSVARVEGYLFQFGVLLIVVEIERPVVRMREGELNREALFTLKHALDLQNVVRMAFPRRWSSHGSPTEAPLRASWLDAERTEIAESIQDFGVKEDFTRIVRERAELPAAKHWQYLTKPFPLYGAHAPGEIAVKQVEDQRIPSMTYLATPDPRTISDWDFARIAFLDDAGESSVGSHSDDFLRDWATRHAYDRF